MSSHRHINMQLPPPSHRLITSVPPPAPPPPLLSTGRSGRSSRRSRSRSRSRSPRRRDRFKSSRDDGDRERGRRSPFSTSAPGGPYRLGSSALPHPQNSTTSLASHALPIQQQSISLITAEAGLPIIRRILDPELVKIPRREGEGARQIFDRDELKESMRRRFAVDEEETMVRLPSPVVAPAPPQPQRIIALIREPAALPIGLGHGSESYNRHPMSSMTSTPVKDRDLHNRSSTFGSTSSGLPYKIQQHDRMLSPPVRERGAERDRDSRHVDAGGRSSDRRRGGSSDRKRERPPVEEFQRGSVDKGRNQKGPITFGRPRSIERPKAERDRPSSSNPRRTSPVRILRRVTRSRSHTPPPMPPEIRRQLERQRDLRSKLSRPANKFHPNSSSNEMGGLGSFRGRGGFMRGSGRESRARGPWEHDMFERDGIDAELKPSKS